MATKFRVIKLDRPVTAGARLSPKPLTEEEFVNQAKTAVALLGTGSIQSEVRWVTGAPRMGPHTDADRPAGDLT